MFCRCPVVGFGLFVALVTLPAITFARGSGGHSSGHHSSGGSVAVRGYYRNGTYVAPHIRSAPDGNFSNNWSTRGNINPYTGKAGTRTGTNGSSFARTTARTSYRTTPRSGYRLGVIDAAPIVEGEDGEDNAPISDKADANTAPGTAILASPPPVSKPELPTRYIAHFASGKQHEVSNFVEDNGSWLLYGVTGGYMRYPTSMVSYFEPTSEAIGVMRKWTDSAGSHHATAKFLRIDGQQAVLAKADGRMINIALDKLSETDRDLAQRLQDLINSKTTKTNIAR